MGVAQVIIALNTKVTLKKKLNNEPQNNGNKVHFCYFDTENNIKGRAT